MSVFTAHTADTAPAAARRSIEGVRRSFGWLPTPVALMAESPQLLTGFLTANAGFEQTDLAPLEREVVVFAVATVNECHVCVALHTGKLTQLGATTDLITALRAGTALPEPRLEALRRFTLAVLEHRGAVPDDELDDFLAAGYQPRHALDVVLGVGAYTISTFANRLTRAPLDPPLAAHAWAPAA
ncbi:carboxymuconolactone decarboxylase family protein [Micromonospora parathelypteridis]|uniref:AhpD family alkylhydroperoxidase n=1 Tax=Micromonospora parathelypteridis TaxID=1839617 RepID=A0A840W2U5_9ACTN|nr:carboxymuconolactone decarboxylase family protein [Micromonospora parathelypteridis]MBB5478589.1 AhpD family alkylhydroperoxidase [Micromonospora parathelypteridis]GGO05519.1 alkyl hydroperoxide reductase AhpD [Micromonospora parathelypteridis]